MYFVAPTDTLKTEGNQLYHLNGSTSHFDDFRLILGLKLGGLGQKIKNKSCSMGLSDISPFSICML